MMSGRLTFYFFSVLSAFLVSIFPFGVSKSTATTSNLSIPSTPFNYAVGLGISGDHNCLIDGSGVVFCWGYNSYGQIGNGQTTPQPVPTLVVNLSNAVSVTPGYEHTCVLTSYGGVKCWGRNSMGQLGDGSNVSRHEPSTVWSMSSGISQVYARAHHTCAITNTRIAKCWGWNNQGQLGIGNSDNQNTPIDVSNLDRNIIQISLGDYHTCALTSSGEVKCWGRNEVGELGNGNFNASTIPVNVIGLENNVIQIATGVHHTCALISTGNVKCWGSNDHKQLGTSAVSFSATPVEVVGLTGVTALTAGVQHTCALLNDGSVKCWGANYRGQLGLDDWYSERATPVTVSGLSGLTVDIKAGGYHNCALNNIGKVMCWGWNSWGQLGNGTFYAGSPVDVNNMNLGAIQIATGDRHSCAITSTGSSSNLKCWGANENGQLGYGDNRPYQTPVSIYPPYMNLQSIAAGDAHTCAKTTGADIYCWGKNDNGQVGNGTFFNKYSPVYITSNANNLATGANHSCISTTSNQVYCWGLNSDGQLGIGNYLTQSSPKLIYGLSSVRQVATGARHTCALTYGGNIKCWGDNSSGQLGNNSVSESTTPISVYGISNAISLVAGGMHTCAIESSGLVKCWGANGSGQIGDGSAVDRGAPISLFDLGYDNTELSAGKSHTCVRKNYGAVLCWGGNQYGQLGQQDLQNHTSPTQINGLTGIAKISAGGQHTCALSSSGSAKCWGLNYDGQLGAGNAWSQTPVTAVNFNGSTPSPTPTQTPIPTITPTPSPTPVVNWKTFLPFIVTNPSPCNLFEPNSNRYNLRFGPIYSGIDYSRPLCQYDPEDNYFFDVITSQTTQLQILLPQTLVGHVTLSLYGPDAGSNSMEQAICSSLITQSNFFLNCPLATSGRYVIRINSQDSNSYYDNLTFYTVRAVFR